MDLSIGFTNAVFKLVFSYLIYVYLPLYCNDHSDVDECAEGSDGCDHNCTNTNGSYYCNCTTGYELELDNRTCAGNEYAKLVYVCMWATALLMLLMWEVSKNNACISYSCTYIRSYFIEQCIVT